MVLLYDYDREPSMFPEVNRGNGLSGPFQRTRRISGPTVRHGTRSRSRTWTGTRE